VQDPAPDDGSPADCSRGLRVVPPWTAAGLSEPVDVAELAARLASALRAVRGYVPHRIWWEEGAADALLTYQATQSP